MGVAPTNAKGGIRLLAHHMVRRGITPAKVFERVDLDHEGELTFEEITVYLRSNGITEQAVPAEHIRQVLRLAGADGGGAVSQARINQAALSKEAIVRIMQKEIQSFLQELMDDGEDSPDLGIKDVSKLVAIVAHNNMKAAMIQFVAVHRAFFKNVRIVTTGTTGITLKKKLGLDIEQAVCSGPLGGDQEIGGMVANGKIGAVFFFIDPLTAHPHEADIQALLRICYTHDCLVANNPASGEAVIHAITTHLACAGKIWPVTDLGQPDSDIVTTYKQEQKQLMQELAEAKQ